MSKYIQAGGRGIGDGGSLISVGALVLIIAVLLAYWVYKDASGRGKDNALLWGLGIGVLTLLTFVGGLIGFGVYIYLRD